ncbi:MAG: hypothetical protein JSW36_07510 [Burkholderiales bacterium]|nr:MAG: hypothetical protein JSW36_07510 [Burkholderiales bacterium]
MPFTDRNRRTAGRAAPLASVAHPLKPRTFTAGFLFDGQRRFMLRPLDF